MKFILYINLNDGKVLTKILTNLTISISKYDNFGLGYIFYRFENDDYLKIKDNIKSFSIQIKDLESNKTTKEFIQVRVKNLKLFSKDKKGVYLCSKCMYNTNIDELNPIKWWIEMKKRVGYTKIGFCNHSLENRIEFRNLFDDYKEFVEVDQFDCLPNFYDLNSPQKYILTYKEFFQKNKYIAHHVFNSMWILFMNECYWNNIDKYRYISVMDRDEIVFPRALNLQRPDDVRNYVANLEEVTGRTIFDDIKCDYSENSIENYLDKLSLQIKKNANSSFYFKNEIKFPNEIYLIIFEELESYFKNFGKKMR
ncbi:hypothetical protein BpHYR1_043922 [Brachionus plicatilis]|uniref:Glycosyltransferase family 92 protein n=1 Tax=Brachionus plicatilis TaxID=10195 RepID=A0A3M7PCZ8_BRAPC|nr:hypothetical protein BpHYR1_043922 [Brachionus plicatilis]